jgi:hypothetical protein
MRTIFSFLLLSLVFITGNPLIAQPVDWRFGFEYIEIEPPFATEAQHDTLLSRLEDVTAVQQVRGGINVNGLGGGWNGMQPTPTSSINLSQSDSWVRRFQKHGFSLIWNLIPNAVWSREGNSTCLDTTSSGECAPGPNFEQHWYNYIRTIVERYDGDGVDDMPGLVVPVRYYVMTQEVYFGGGANGDAGDAKGEGFWEDNMYNLVRLHDITHRAIRDADPTGNTRLVGSGGWLLDLYSDFPDYPLVDGPTVQARLGGANLSHSIYRKGFDSLAYLLGRLGDDSDGVKCDYIGWHPHSGWKATDQSFRFIRRYAPSKPIFVDDMWSYIFTDVFPYPGYAQFIGIDSMEGDFPNATVASIANLRDRLNAGDTAALNWYNAKGARDAVKCFTTAFGGGAERASFTFSNDFNPNHPLYLLSQLWRYTGLVGHKNTNYAHKPVTYTMKLLVDKLHDFTSVQLLDVSSNPYTRVYKFERGRGTPCYIAWSEAVPNPVDPSVPNGETVTFDLGSDTAIVTHIITRPGTATIVSNRINTPAHSLSMKLGFEPVIIEEGAKGQSGVEEPQGEKEISLHVYPDPARDHFTIILSARHAGHASIALYDPTGRMVRSIADDIVTQGDHSIEVRTSGLATGIYVVRVTMEGEVMQERVMVVE